MDAFKIDKSKIEALNTRYKEKAKELTALAKKRDAQLEKIGTYLSTACCEIEDNKKETGITELSTVLSLDDIITVEGTKLSSNLSINININPETDYYQMSPQMKTNLYIQAKNYIGCPEETLPLFTQNEKRITDVKNKIEIISDKNKEELDVTLN